MKVYFAGCVGLLAREQKNIQFYESRLFSYFYIIPGQIDHETFDWVKAHVREEKNKEGGILWEEKKKTPK